jgi:hypothetical protein
MSSLLSDSETETPTDLVLASDHDTDTDTDDPPTKKRRIYYEPTHSPMPVEEDTYATITLNDEAGTTSLDVVVKIVDIGWDTMRKKMMCQAEMVGNKDTLITASINRFRRISYAPGQRLTVMREGKERVVEVKAIYLSPERPMGVQYAVRFVSKLSNREIRKRRERRERRERRARRARSATPEPEGASSEPVDGCRREQEMV